jgi:hypothetical protein
MQVDMSPHFDQLAEMLAAAEALRQQTAHCLQPPLTAQTNC